MSRPTRKRVLWIITAVAAVWLVAATARLVAAYGSATSGLDAVENLGALATDDLGKLIGSIGGDVDDVPEETAAQMLSDASADFENVEDHLGAPSVALLRHLPVIGRQLSSAGALAGAAATTASAGSVAFEQLNSELSGTAQTPEKRLRTARETEAVLTELQTALDGVELGPTEKLLPPLAKARNRFDEQYSQTMETLDVAVTAVRGVNDFLGGPSTYLVLAANNAEMRAGSGMFLQAGTLTVEDGRFSVSDFVPTKQLRLEEPGAGIDPDIQDLWGWLIPAREWRNLAMSPRFDESAQMAAEMWAAAGKGAVDGVIAVDVAGLRELLDVTGPVSIRTEEGLAEIGASDIVDYLLLEQYVDFVDQRDERRDQLGRVVDSVFEAFNTRSWSVSKLLAALQDAGAGRHIMLWSDKPVQQDAWDALGATSAVTANSMMVSVLNRGGNKLDQFLEVDATLSVVRDASSRRLALEVTLQNTAPRPLPYYVEGPYPNSQLTAGDYLGLLSITLPGGAGNPTMTGAEIRISGDDGPTRVVAADVLLPLGATQRIRLEFDLPESWNTIEVLPSARIPPVTWHAGSGEWADTEPVPVDLDAL